MASPFVGPCEYSQLGISVMYLIDLFLFHLTLVCFILLTGNSSVRTYGVSRGTAAGQAGSRGRYLPTSQRNAGIAKGSGRNSDLKGVAPGKDAAAESGNADGAIEG